MGGTVTYDCIPEVANLSLLLLAFGCVLPPPQIHSVSTLAVTLSVAQISEFLYLSVKICQNILVAGKLDEAWSVTV